MAEQRSDGERHERALLAVIAIMLLGFSFVQISVVPTLPAVQHDLHTSTAWSTWIITAFLLVGAIATPMLGKLADQYGRKPLLQAVLVAFVISSVGSGLAPNIGVLIAFRGLSGAAAVFLALSIVLVSEHLRRDRAAFAVGMFGVLFAVGNILAAVVAPVLTELVSWRLMYAFPAVAGAAALALSPRWVPASAVRAKRRLDAPGAFLLALAIGLLMLALTVANTWGWASAPIVGLFAGSVAAAVLLVGIELRAPEPMIDLRMLMRRPVLLTNAATALMGFSVFGVLVLVPRFVTTPRGLSRADASLVDYGFGATSRGAGVYIVFMMVAGLLGGLAIGVVTRRWGWRWPFVTAFVLFALGMSLLGVLHERPWEIALAMFVMGPGVPTGTSLAGKLVADAVKPEERSLVAGLNIVAYYIGGVVGAQACAAILSGVTISGTEIARGSAYTASFYICAGVALLGIPLSVLSMSARRLGMVTLPEPAGEAHS